MPEHESLVRLRHMLDYARDAVAIASGKSRGDLETDHMLDLALKHAVMLVGEAANHVSTDIQEEHSDIAWSQMIGMRNRLIHGYDFIDHDILWSTVSEDLPILIKQLEEIVPPEEAEG